MRRARLLINREGLAPVRIVWPLQPAIEQNPRYSVYDLLKDVNKAFPLDDGASGLEDYTVEIDGCDLVHYMPIAHLVSDQDEITIRPLTTTEIREHRKGGRRQISKIGRVLLDGVAPGRLFVGPARDRPPVLGIDRPAKRRKISNGFTNDDSGQDVRTWKPIASSGRRRALRSASGSKNVHFEDSEEDQEEGIDKSSAIVLAVSPYENEDEDDEDDEDFDPTEGDEDEDDESEGDQDIEDDEKEEVDEDEDEDTESEDEDEELSATTAELDRVLKRLSGVETECQDEEEEEEEEEDDDDNEDEDEDEEDDGETDSSSEEGGDSNGSSYPSSSSADSDDSDGEKEAEPRARYSLNNNFKAKELQDSSSDSSSESGGDDDSEDESFQGSDARNSSDSSSDSSLDDDSDDSDDDGEEEEEEEAPNKIDSSKLKNRESIEAEKPDEVSSKIITSSSKPPRGLPPMVTTAKPSTTPPLIATTTRTPLPPTTQIANPPGLPEAAANIPFKGTSSTRSRNQRRRDSKRLEQLIREGHLPVGSTKEDLYRYREQENGGNENTSDSNSKTLNDINAAPLTNGSTRHSDELQSSRDLSPRYTPMEPLEVIVEEVNVSLEVPVPSEQEASKSPQADEASSSSISTNRRRPGVSDATKRTLLGSLGLKLPRNQAEDEKQREDWKKKHAKFVGNKTKGFLDAMVGKEGVHSRFDEDGKVTAEVPTAQPVEDQDLWKEKIQLSAVECDEEYIDEEKTLKPSFPFDPRQLRGYGDESNFGNKSKNKKKKKNKKNKRKQDKEDAYQEEEEWNPNFYDASMGIDSAQQPGQAERSTQGASEEFDDMPPIPENLSDYPVIKEPVLPESILVFTKLVCDANNNYATSYKRVTARVLAIEGTNIIFQLAKRDCPKAVYDEETGERIFGRFHMPGSEDTDGIEELDLGLMYDGRVIKEGVVVTESHEILAAEEEKEIDRVPETILEGVNMEKDNVQAQIISQIEDEDIPMPEAGGAPVLLAPNDSIQSSSFLEPPFQTNGSDGNIDTDDEIDDNEVQGEERLYEDNVMHDRASRSPIAPLANVEDENVDSSAEAHRYEDAPSQDLIFPDDLVPKKVSTPTVSETGVPKPATESEEPVVQVPRTPDSGALGFQDEMDISALNPGDAAIVGEMIKIKKECPEDPDLLREALKPFHHPPETKCEADVSIDISPLASPIIKKERVSTQEALGSPVTPLKDITGRSTNDDNVEHIEESLDEVDDSKDSRNLGSGSGYLATAKSRCSIS
ncbi:hypothetical protein TWF718_006939 [Orbilia javanica]|uniref:DUF7357 domain-containing protein n=1 Tax=Orbilia javanica TaxID=47235 RepID=A0AAN8RHX1_9PEZI